VDYTQILEDFLDNIGVSFDAFRREMTGSWIFGYIAALQRAGVRCVMIAVSGRVENPWRFQHLPTGAQVCVLPAPEIYRTIRRRLLNPYASTVEKAFADYNLKGIRYVLLAAVRELAPYLTTPLRLLAQELRREGCQAILCQDYEHPRFDACVLVGLLLGLPVFATFQGGNWQNGRLEGPLRPWTLRACAGLIIGPDSEVKRVRASYSIPAGKVARIFNPIDLATWNPSDRSQAREAAGIPPQAQVVVWHGRIDIHNKGLDVLLDAWKQVSREGEGKELELLLVGFGMDTDKFRERLAASRLRNVQWRDEFVRDKAELRCYLSAADVYVFPSRHEGFPLAPIEAMACGLPVVAADAPGIRDILEGSEISGGLIVPTEDATALARALGRVLEDRALRLELGTRARQRAETAFSLDAIGQRLRDFLFGKN
jgi:starch synthase